VDTTASVDHRTQGIAATDHERFGKFPVDTTGPQSAKAIAPSAEAGAENRRAKKPNAPRAASGNGNATHRLKPSTSPPTSRAITAGSRNIWLRASEYADCPPPMYGSQSGPSPDSHARRNQR
jgi:hypothetical protein